VYLSPCIELGCGEQSLALYRGGRHTQETSFDTSHHLCVETTDVCCLSLPTTLLPLRQGWGACYWSTSHWKTPTRWPLHVWNGRGCGPWLHNSRQQNEITALCHLWQCVVAALDKTNDGAEWRINARSVTDFHWTGTYPIHSDRSRSRVSTKIGAISTPEKYSHNAATA